MGDRMKRRLWKNMGNFGWQLRKLSCLIVFFLSFVAFDADAQFITDRLNTIKYAPYPFVRFVVHDTNFMEPLSDDEFLDKAGKVVFRVNRYDVFTNDSLLDVLDREVLPMVNRDSLRLVRIVLRGAASPEGPYRNNEMLGNRRVQALRDFLLQRLTVPVKEAATNVEAVIEDYRLLLAMMRRANDPDADLVQEICDTYLPKGAYTKLKKKLKTVRGGELWRHLLDDYFPELRATRLMLYFEYASSTPPTILEPVEKPWVEPVAQLTPVVVEKTFVPDVVRLPRREILSIKSNMLFDVAYMPGYNRWCPIPNVALEFYPLHGHFTVGASIDFPWWQHYYKHKFFQVRNYQVEGRYYLRSGDIRKNPPGEGAAFRGVFFSAYAHAALYGICFNANHGWEGEALGAGVGAGYMLPLNRKGHWRLEFSAQVGFLYSGYDPYQYENPVNPAYRDHLYYYKWTGKKADFRERQHRLTWIGPTRVGVTLSYDLLYRRRVKSGVSFRNHEYQYFFVEQKK